MRMPDQTTKEPTGAFNRDNLMQYLKEEAIKTDVSDPSYVPFEKKTRGRVWKKKEQNKNSAKLLPDDLTEVLDGASEEELLELAGNFRSFLVIFLKIYMQLASSLHFHHA